MEPKIVKTNGKRLGNAAAVGQMLGIKADSFQWYVREGKPAGNPPPAHFKVDTETSQRLYDMKAVKEWNDRRTGRGNWGGEGARAREKYRQGPGAAVDADGQPIEREPATPDDAAEAGGDEVAAAVAADDAAVLREQVEATNAIADALLPKSEAHAEQDA